MSVEVSVVLPAYNEERTIESTVHTTLATLAEFLPDDSYEVIVAEDGCEDRTPEIADRLAAEDDRVRHFHSDERLGRGGALERAFAASEGGTLVYFDTDLATDMKHLEELVEPIRSGEYDVATGSRWMPENVADRPAKRGVPSRGFNTLTRLFLRSDLRDHQCGFKAFDREALFGILPDVADDHWFWDTEVLVRAQRKGYRVKEFAVDWEPKGDTKVDLVRDVLGMGSQILRTWWEFAVQPRLTRRVTLAAGTLLVFVALALMTVYLDPSAVLDALEGADPVLVGVAALAYLVSWPVRGARYRDILAELSHRERLGFLTGAVFISQTGNLVFPARAGDAVRAYVVKARRGVPYPSGFASLAVERVFDLLTITALGGATLVVLSLSGYDFGGLQALPPEYRQSGRTALQVSGLVAGLAVFGLAALILSARTGDGRRIERLVNSVSNDSYADYVAGVLERFVGDMQAVANDRGAFARVGATSLLVWTLDVITAAVVFAAFDVGLAPLALLGISFFAVSVGNLAKVLPLSPGGIGLYEGAFTLLVVALTGIAWPVALAAAIVDHAVKNLVTVFGGVASTLALNVSLTKAVEEASEVEREEEAIRSDDD
jgi:uncharacterized protein (TIRG00374 family)